MSIWAFFLKKNNVSFLSKVPRVEAKISCPKIEALWEMMSMSPIRSVASRAYEYDDLVDWLDCTKSKHRQKINNLVAIILTSDLWEGTLFLKVGRWVLIMFPWPNGVHRPKIVGQLILTMVRIDAAYTLKAELKLYASAERPPEQRWVTQCLVT